MMPPDEVAATPIHDGRPLLFPIITDAEERVRAEGALARQARCRLDVALRH